MCEIGVIPCIKSQANNILYTDYHNVDVCKTLEVGKNVCTNKTMSKQKKYKNIFFNFTCMCVGRYYVRGTNSFVVYHKVKSDFSSPSRSLPRQFQGQCNWSGRNDFLCQRKSQCPHWFWQYLSEIQPNQKNNQIFR